MIHRRLASRPSPLGKCARHLPSVPPMGLLRSFAFFGGAALLLLASTRLVIPRVSEATGIEPVVAWFLVGGALVFLPLLFAGLLLVRQEARSSEGPRWTARLRFRHMDRTDWLWGIGALIVIGLLTGFIQAVGGAHFAEAKLHPQFMAFDPLSTGERTCICRDRPWACVMRGCPEWTAGSVFFVNPAGNAVSGGVSPVRPIVHALRTH